MAKNMNIYNKISKMCQCSYKRADDAVFGIWAKAEETAGNGLYQG